MRALRCVSVLEGQVKSRCYIAPSLFFIKAGRLMCYSPLSFALWTSKGIWLLWSSNLSVNGGWGRGSNRPYTAQYFNGTVIYSSYSTASISLRWGTVSSSNSLTLSFHVYPRWSIVRSRQSAKETKHNQSELLSLAEGLIMSWKDSDGVLLQTLVPGRSDPKQQKHDDAFQNLYIPI